jgi:hypothetical protein
MPSLASLLAIAAGAVLLAGIHFVPTLLKSPEPPVAVVEPPQPPAKPKSKPVAKPKPKPAPVCWQFEWRFGKGEWRKVPCPPGLPE